MCVRGSYGELTLYNSAVSLAVVLTAILLSASLFLPREVLFHFRAAESSHRSRGPPARHMVQHRHRCMQICFAEVEKRAENIDEARDLSVDSRSPSATGMAPVRQLLFPPGVGGIQRPWKTYNVH